MLGTTVRSAAHGSAVLSLKCHGKFGVLSVPFSTALLEKDSLLWHIKKNGTQIVSDATCDEDSRWEGCRGQGMEELETIPAWDLGKVKSKKEFILESTW